MSNVLNHLVQNGISSDSYLPDIYETEEILLFIHNLNLRIDHLKGLKEHRMNKLNGQIENYENRIDQLRNLILNTLKKHSPDIKKFEFPDIGNVIRRVNKETWEIEDENKVTDFLVEQGHEKEVLIPVKPKLDKKKAKELINDYQNRSINVPGAKYKQSTDTISISFDKDINAKALNMDIDVTDQLIDLKTIENKDIRDLEV